MTKRLIAFDVDDTLVKSKNPITDEMRDLLARLLEHYQVAIISGSRYEIFQTNIIEPLGSATAEELRNMHILPTCGTRYYTYQGDAANWRLEYAEDFTDEQKSKIAEVCERHAKAAGLWPADPYGEVIEDRLSQISMSLLGQKAPAEAKYEWFNRHKEDAYSLTEAIAEELPDFEVRYGGTTTVDITAKGIDKAYGMQKLLDALGMKKSDALFIGDRLEEGGNDYPVRAMGIDTIAVEGWETTPYVVRGILSVS
ncbi:HAD hydrolase, family IIB [Candidatus Saccharibacteria bacterium RAAC3_TM7_1]|nr:HAD hydrolase, family IIB [Candidatus Saccharibacteria bacterium RAAC3_TM7_1]HCZ28473.1 HAD-IIB family hydrolase [Candidatus Saccharibacteria bacterium]